MDIRSFFTRDKLLAFAIHLLASIAIFLTLLAINLTQWYPSPLFQTDGGLNVLRIVIFVDVVLGPTLTLIIYRKGKPGLKMDMGIIITCQLIALVAGGWINYSERPIYIALDEGQLSSVAASVYTESGDTLAKVEQFGKSNTRIIAIKLPKDFNQQSEVLASSLAKNIPVQTFSNLFKRPTLDDFRQPDEKLLSLEMVANKNQTNATVVDRFRSEHRNADEKYILVPFRSRYRDWAGVIDRQTLKLVDVLNIRLIQEDYFEQKGGKLLPADKK